MAAHCEMCGAVEGRPHHDPAAHGREVTLHIITVPMRRTLAQEGERTVCMLCHEGIYAIRWYEKRVRHEDLHTR